MHEVGHNVEDQTNPQRPTISAVFGRQMADLLRVMRGEKTGAALGGLP
jgi:hypothetical protein